MSLQHQREAAPDLQLSAHSVHIIHGRPLNEPQHSTEPRLRLSSAALPASRAAEEAERELSLPEPRSRGPGPQAVLR